MGKGSEMDREGVKVDIEEKVEVVKEEGTGAGAGKGKDMGRGSGGERNRGRTYRPSAQPIKPLKHCLV